jgi:hypothetical protein
MLLIFDILLNFELHLSYSKCFKISSTNIQEEQEMGVQDLPGEAELTYC